MSSLGELIIYYCVKIFGIFLRFLPVETALGLGRMFGMIAYYIDFKHRLLIYTNLKIAFAKTKSPHEIKQISKQVFQSYGQNFTEVFRLPLMSPENLEKFVKMEGKEHVRNALKEGKGLILLAMHFGSWELASVASSMLGHPYKVLVRPQKKFTKLDQLLNAHRASIGSVVVERGLGTREIIRSLRNNEIIGMVVDQGGRDGVLVPFFDRQASMSEGAVRMGLKMGIPICFAIIMREKGPFHRLVIHEPFKLVNTENQEKDVEQNLFNIMQLMEKYIREHPAEYMWFYKIWKYSKESVLMILNDGKTGHLRQSQTIAAMMGKALQERGVHCSNAVVDVKFKSQWSSRLISLFSLFASGYFFQGRMGFLRWFLEKESFEQITSFKADFIVSCGSSVAGINHLLTNEQQARSVVILKPGLLPYRSFDLVILPKHDHRVEETPDNVVITQGAPNLITAEYLEQQSNLLLNRYSHLKLRVKSKIGILIGGDTKDYFLSEANAKLVINQIKEAVGEINADILLTTSRRTSERVENMLQRELKKHPACQLMILANRSNVPEAVGGILGLSDIIVVSGDSISMISEAASSGKDTIVFPVQNQTSRQDAENHKHNRFIDGLNAEGYIVSVDIKGIRQAIYDVAKNKIKTKKLDDNAAILEAVKQVV